MNLVTEVGFWSEIKLEIIREYASAYSQVLSAQKFPSLYHVYIDAFAGAGFHVSRKTGDWVLGSPLIALETIPPFKEYHFIDLDGGRASLLREAAGRYGSNVWVYEGNANQVLLNDVFPRVRYEDYRRGLCLLDPYGLHYTWEVVSTAGKMRSIELFLNFPVAAMNRTVLLRDPSVADQREIQRMTAFWGDDSWREAAYTTKRSLFGDLEKLENPAMAEAYRRRLQDVAGFNYVSEPLPMRNSKNAPLYYLILASQKPAASAIITDIFHKYRQRRR
ncbi:MAG: three-Cys-motif partner protein TcmP [Deltaproteobacteria bacterium]|nr:three-Cys-motif partner protein TcmP [Deltaproteobacteria bacterium]